VLIKWTPAPARAFQKGMEGRSSWKKQTWKDVFLSYANRESVKLIQRLQQGKCDEASSWNKESEYTKRKEGIEN